MTTKSVASFRLGEETMEHLRYLTQISHKSQAEILAELVDVYFHAVVAEAFGFTKLEDIDPENVIRGGTIITVEEQKALKTVRDRLAGNWEEIGGRPR